MKNDLENRVEKLEELCAHQGAEIDTLSDTIRDQWEQLELLKKGLLRFWDRLTEVEESGDGEHVNTKPPHY